MLVVCDIKLHIEKNQLISSYNFLYTITRGVYAMQHEQSRRHAGYTVLSPAEGILFDNEPGVQLPCHV